MAADDVRIPAKPTDPEGEDLLVPTKKFLIGLGLQASDEDLRAAKAADPTTSSAEVVTAASFAITKRVQSLIVWSSAGGAGAAIAGAVFAAYKEADAVVQAAFILGAALIIFGVAIGLSRVMDGDVRGRAAATTSRIEGQVAVACEFLRVLPKGATAAAAPSAAQPAPTSPTEAQVLGALGAYTDLKVSTAQGTKAVTGVRWTSEEGLELRITGGDFIKAGRVTGYEG